MNPALTILILILLAVLSLVSLMQLLYSESLRLLAKKTLALDYFQENLEPEFGQKPERGVQIFSLWKHAIMIGLEIGRAHV